MRPFPLVLPAAALALATACGGGSEPPARVRLVECSGRLIAPAPAAAETVFRADFAAPAQGWSVISSTHDVLAVEPEALRVTAGSEDGRPYFTLAGRGAVYRALAVEPDTCYRFEGELRGRGLEPEGPFTGASFWVAEIASRGTPGELFAQGGRFDLRHPVEGVLGSEGWQSRVAAFRTRSDTHTLIVGCVLAVDEPLRAGEVDFRRVELVRIAEGELWEHQAARAVAEAYRGEGLPARDDWHARRRVDAMLGAESRPSILALPDERLELELRVPDGEAVLETGLAPWPAALPAGAGVLRFRVRLDGREVLAHELELAPAAELAWTDVRVPLAGSAGARVHIELTVEGPVPGVFGAPVVHAPGDTPGWNVVLVSIDTLRADRVGAYGARSGATPVLDALAEGGLVFTDTSACAPYTLPAHATLFTGQFPSVHGVEDKGRVLAPQRSPVLARRLAALGYRTQAFAAGVFLLPDFGFQAGFDGFAIADPLRHAGSRYFEDFRRIHPDQVASLPGEGTREPEIERWLEQHAREPFFLFLHTYEVHDYDPPPGPVGCESSGCTTVLEDYKKLLLTPGRTEPLPGSAKERAHLGHLYDAALRHVDQQLGRILATLERLGLAERTLVVVTSDHGEELFERGFLQHGKSLHREVLSIPWLMRVPGRTPGRVEIPALQADIAPTILGLLGQPPDARMQGRDLLTELARGRSVPRPLWSEVNDAFARKSSLRDGDWKLVHGPLDAHVAFPNAREWELYDLADDPGETRDLASQEPARLAALQHALEAFQAGLLEERARLGEVVAGSVDDETLRALDHAGYGGSQPGR